MTDLKNSETKNGELAADGKLKRKEYERELANLHVEFVKLKPLGAGEASQGPMAAAIANAFAHAIGHRLRDLPFSPERVQTALG